MATLYYARKTVLLESSRFGLLIAVLLKIQVLIDVTPSLWVSESHRFEGFKYEKI